MVEPGIGRVWAYFHKHPIAARLFPVLWILLIGGIAFLWNLGSTGLVDETEPLFAEAARQMTQTGDWVTPYFNGETRFDKPPLIYWLMAIAYQAIGVNEWAVRLPSALAAIALMGMGFYTLQRFGSSSNDPPTAAIQRWLAALIGTALFALHPLTIVWARTGVSDMLLCGCMGVALLAFFVGYAGREELGVFALGVPAGWGEASTRKRDVETQRHEHPQNPKPLTTNNQQLTTTTNPTSPSPWYLTFYVCIALAILTKGPVGMVLPGLIVGAFLLYVGNGRSVLREMRPLLGLGIILLLALPWYILVTLANGEAFIDSFFGYHNLERFTEVVNHHWAPWYFYFVIVLVGFAPWSLYLPVAIARLQFWTRSRWQHQPRSSHLGLFALFWFGGVFGFFTIAVTKLPSYVLPLMPAAAILVALVWSEQMTQPPKSAWGIRLSGVLNSLLFLLLGGVMLYAPQLVKGDRAMPQLAALLQTSGLPILGGAIGLATAVGILLLLRSRQDGWLWFANTIGFLALIVVVLLPALALVDSQRQLPLRQLAQVVVQERYPSEPLVMIGAKKPSIVFYTRQPVIFKLRTETATIHLRQQMTDPAKAPTTLILSSPDALTDMGLQPNQYQVLGKAFPYQLVRFLGRGGRRDEG